MIFGRKIKLDLLSRQDLEALRVLRYSPDIRRNFRGFELPYPEEQDCWYQKLVHDQTKRYFVGRSTTNSRIEAVLNYSSLNLHDKTANVGWYFTKPAGLGRDRVFCVLLFLKYLFSEIGLRKVYSEVFHYNSRALDFNQRIGFVREGLLEKHTLKDNEYHDLVLVGLFSSNFYEVNCKMLGDL